jgi:hypothetical protein
VLDGALLAADAVGADRIALYIGSARRNTSEASQVVGVRLGPGRSG